MRTIQLLKKMSDASKNIFRVYHIRIIAPQKNGSHDMKQTNSSILIVRNMCVLTSASMIVLSFRHEVMIGNHRNKTTEN